MNSEADISTVHEQSEQLDPLGGTYRSDIISRMREDPKAIGKLFKEGKYPYTDRIPRRVYMEEKARLQIELLKVQNWVKTTGQKIVVIFEGRDAAGNWGAVSAAFFWIADGTEGRVTGTVTDGSTGLPLAASVSVDTLGLTVPTDPASAAP